MQSIYLNSIVILLSHRVFWLFHGMPTKGFQMNFYVQWTPSLSFILFLFCFCVRIWKVLRLTEHICIQNLSPLYQMKWLDNSITNKKRTKTRNFQTIISNWKPLTGKCVSSHELSMFAVNGSGCCAIFPFCCSRIDSFFAVTNTDDITFEWSEQSEIGISNLSINKISIAQP